jgi:hypothetical protein
MSVIGPRKRATRTTHPLRPRIVSRLCATITIGEHLERRLTQGRETSVECREESSLSRMSGRNQLKE